jgi:hypothetical protein
MTMFKNNDEQSAAIAAEPDRSHLSGGVAFPVRGIHTHTDAPAP